MKYLFKQLIFVVIAFLILKSIFYILDNNHEIEYNIGNFDVKEKFEIKGGKHIYTYNLKNEDFEITFDVDKNFNKSEKTIEDIKYFEDEKCILPIFKNGEIIYDVMCKNDDTVYFAYDLTQKIPVKNVKKYKSDHFLDNASAQNYEANRVYKSNIPENHYLFVENYKGIVLINNEVSTIKLFDNDIYKKELSTVVGKYYLVANYNDELTFKSFYLVNLINGKQKEIRSVNPISFDSYIQGVVNDDVYLYDLDNKVQYKIDLDTELVTKVAGNNNIKYYDGKWTTMTLKEATEKKVFVPYNTTKFSNYDKSDKLDKYYVYEKEGKYYNVYSISENNKKQRTFLFKTSDPNSVTYLDGYIYFRKDNSYYCYSTKGIRKLIENTEMQFNDTLKFGVYEK